MPRIDIMGEDVEFVCTTYTTTIYEQEFVNDPFPKVTGDLIADVYGMQKIRAEEILQMDENGDVVIYRDYTKDNWQAVRRALWAMVKTAMLIRKKHGEEVGPIPSWRKWDEATMEWQVDFREVSDAVCNEGMRGLFRAGAAAPETTSEEE